jgi:hypothetical protein
LNSFEQMLKQKILIYFYCLFSSISVFIIISRYDQLQNEVHHICTTGGFESLKIVGSIKFAECVGRTTTVYHTCTSFILRII